MKKETKDKKLDEAFSKLRERDLKKIIKAMTDDETIYKAVKKELDKILNKEVLSKRLIEDAEKSLARLERKACDFAEEIDKHGYWENEYNFLISNYESTVEKTTEQYVNDFLEYNMEDEALRFFLSAFNTVNEAANCDSEPDIKDECSYDNPSYKKLIKETGVSKEKLDELIKKYSDDTDYSYTDIFSSPDIKIK